MSSDAAPIRILSVDDHALIRQGIAGLLAVQTDMTLVAEASNGREAIQQFRLHRPDITLMDLHHESHTDQCRRAFDKLWLDGYSLLPLPEEREPL